jgi:dipeptidyl aminopeptidase/acylaminoacyl peptidase
MLKLDRRAFFLGSLNGIAASALSGANAPVMQPVVSEAACPLEKIEPVASDGYRGLGVLRKPPGDGPFPAIIWLHAGITTVPLSRLEFTARNLANPARFLAAGYVLVASTYRSRDADLQSPLSLEDCLAVVEFVRRLPYVDAQSVVVFGCSGGGDLALEIAARVPPCAVIAEEPASVLMSNVFNNTRPKKGERFTPADSLYLLENGKQYYTAEFQKVLQAKIRSISSPILILQGEVDRREVPINRFNAEVLIPELRNAKKRLIVNIYPGQAHCFCAMSGDPRPYGLTPSASWSSAGLKAFQDCDAFCRRYLRTQPSPISAPLLKEVAVRDGLIAQ